MNYPITNEFAIPVPILPPDVVLCEGISRPLWYTNEVTLKNESGMDVARGICHSVDAALVIDMDGKPLGDNLVAIQIAESLCEAEVLSAWMWSMHS